MLLSDRDIRAEIEGGRVVLDPWDPQMLQPSSVDVRMDKYFRLFDNHKYPYIDPAEDQPDLTRLVEIAAGEPLSFAQDDLVIRGHAIEARINAERLPNFSPCPGKVTQYHAPGGLGVRMDSALYAGYSIPPNYDSLIAKLIVHGRDRDEALARLNRALGELIVDGVDSTIPLFRRLLKDPDIQHGDYSIHWLERFVANRQATKDG